MTCATSIVPTAPPPPAPRPAKVTLWHLQLPHSMPPNATRLLDQTEGKRAAAIRDPVHRRRYVAAHVMLRQILGAETGQNPARIRIRAGPHGKPALLDMPDLHFNLSHSADHAVVALSRSSEIGVDIEQRRPNSQARRIVARLFASEEHAALRDLDNAAFDSAFSRLWVMKEAFIKADGRGLALPLNAFAICPFRARILRTPHGRSEPASLQYIPLGTGLDCALVGNNDALDGTILIKSNHNVLKS